MHEHVRISAQTAHFLLYLNENETKCAHFAEKPSWIDDSEMPSKQFWPHIYI